MPRPLIVAVCQQKGGVGKTAATTGIADAAAQLGKSVLVIDMDPQANATTNLGIEDTPPFTANDVLTADPVTREVARGGILDAFVPAGEAWGSRIHVVASELALAAREQDQDLGREYRLRTALDDEAISQWDLIVIDCPPSLGQLTVNALAAADAALLITEPRAASVDGLAQMVRTLTTVRQHYNPQLRIAGIVINKYRPDRRDRVEWAGQVRSIYGDLVIENFLPDREIVAAAASACSPLSAYGAKSSEITDVFAAIAQRLLASHAGAGA